jgi:hypothetical protein
MLEARALRELGQVFMVEKGIGRSALVLSAHHLGHCPCA